MQVQLQRPSLTDSEVRYIERDLHAQKIIVAGGRLLMGNQRDTCDDRFVCLPYYGTRTACWSAVLGCANN